MPTDLVKKALLVVAVLAGLLIFILIAPILIVSVWLLMWGFVSFMIVAVIVYGLIELWKGK